LKRILFVFACALATAPTSGHTTSPPLAIGIIPAGSPAITEALVNGAQLAIDQAASADGLGIAVVVAASGTHWSTASTPAIELAFGSEVVALIGPPDRATAHLVAQIGSRAHIPVFATTQAPSIGNTGSYWVIPLLALADTDTDTEDSHDSAPTIDRDVIPAGFESAFRDRFGRSPDSWATIGYKAASAVCDAVRIHNTDRYRIVQALKSLAPTDQP
jgi:hypothetical protein